MRFKFLILVAFVWTCCGVSCKPKEALEPNEENKVANADVELANAREIIWATFAVTDIDQAIGFAGEADIPKFYEARDSGYFLTVRDVSARQIAIGWNNTMCKDGCKRNGSIFMMYLNDPILNPMANPNAEYYRDFGYSALIATTDHVVDGWKIVCKGPRIINTVSSVQYNSATEPLTWSIEGKYRMLNEIDTLKKIIWDGKLVKTLTNSTDSAIFKPNKMSAINWIPRDLNSVKAAICVYSGIVTGTTSTNASYTLAIDPATPLRRDFSCSTDPNLANGKRSEYHPFIAGLASLSLAIPGNSIRECKIYLGNDGLNVNMGPCDSVATLKINGTPFPMNLKR